MEPFPINKSRSIIERLSGSSLHTEPHCSLGVDLTAAHDAGHAASMLRFQQGIPDRSLDHIRWERVPFLLVASEWIQPHVKLYAGI